MDEILLNIESKERRCAHLRNGVLQDLVVERLRERQMAGNIYRGKVTNILRNIQSAFVDIDEGDNGFIHISDILENTRKFEQIFDMDFDLDYDLSEIEETAQEKIDIDQLLKADQAVLVQVVKEPMGSKGARLTSNISIPGRYLVLLPNSNHRGVSRKIEDHATRERLKRLVRSFEVPKNMGLICRTASDRATSEQLIEEAGDLLAIWEEIIENFTKSTEPALLYAESDLIKRSLITAINKRFDRLLVDDYETYQLCRRLADKYAAEHPLKVEFYRDKIPIFERFNIEREIEKALRSKIWLSSGGYLFFERTEAMYTVDVNSGRSTNSSRDGDVEESLVRINLEAALEIARQLRIRNVGGLVICDFIDMRMGKSQRRVLDKLKERLREDSAKCNILDMSEFGIVEMTRQRHRCPLEETLFMKCPYCFGLGKVKSPESVAIEIERTLKKIIQVKQQFSLRLVVHPEQLEYLKEIDQEYLLELAAKMSAHLELDSDDLLHLTEYHFYSTVTQQKIEV